MAHELVHALQEKRYPGMPDEIAEREAFYYQRLTPSLISSYLRKGEYVWLYDYINDDLEKDIKDAAAMDQESSG